MWVSERPPPVSQVPSDPARDALSASVSFSLGLPKGGSEHLRVRGQTYPIEDFSSPGDGNTVESSVWRGLNSPVVRVRRLRAMGTRAPNSWLFPYLGLGAPMPAA